MKREVIEYGITLVLAGLIVIGLYFLFQSKLIVGLDIIKDIFS